ncbi:CapA family protein [Candidatus Kaiserbacteria bacterium]|nr:CapA family protein [Candidatus Kaiserbacteria bacterium]
MEKYVRFAAQPASATIIFGGDLMFDRTIRMAMNQHGEDYIFSCIDDLLKSADLVVANLEGPITTHPSKSVGTKVGGEGNFTFTFPTSTAALLGRHNVRLVSLGNNHSMNFGREGLAQTKRWLDGAGVSYFGDPDLGESERVERVTIGGILFSFVNWSDWTSDKTDHTVAQVRKEAEEGRVVVVFAHWGDEYVPVLPRVRQLAHSFADAGASIVIGSHPHIVQEKEFYNGTYIYYSLGNFIFDQYWNEAVRKGLLLSVEFTPQSVGSVKEIPIDNQTDRRSCAV